MVRDPHKYKTRDATKSSRKIVSFPKLITKKFVNIFLPFGRAINIKATPPRACREKKGLEVKTLIT
jgi:hypothetical protein